MSCLPYPALGPVSPNPGVLQATPTAQCQQAARRVGPQHFHLQHPPQGPPFQQAPPGVGSGRAGTIFALVSDRS